MMQYSDIYFWHTFEELLIKNYTNKTTIGYPFFYGNKSHLDFNFVSKEGSGFNLAHAFSLSIVIEQSQSISFGEEFFYKICDEISNLYGSFQVIPETQSLILDFDEFCNVISQRELIIDNISSDLSVTRVITIEQAQKFFQDKKIIVQAGGVQGAVYRAGSYLQSVGSAGLVTRTLGYANLA